MYHNKIVSQSLKFCDENGLRLLYLSDNGSHAWGYNSQNSDFDLKGIVVHKDKDKYKSLFTVQDNYQFKHDELYDYTFWDIRKFLALLYKSNAQTYELTFSSKIYYKNTKYGNTLKELVEYYLSSNLREVAFHYYGLAYKTYKERVRNVSEPTTKKYLYVLRPMMAATQIVYEGKLPDLDFDKLFSYYVYNFMNNDKIIRDIDEILEYKRAGLLSVSDKKRYDDLDEYLKVKLASTKEYVENSSNCDNLILDSKKLFDLVYNKIVFD